MIEEVHVLKNYDEISLHVSSTGVHVQKKLRSKLAKSGSKGQDQMIMTRKAYLKEYQAVID